jgi:hypothetical protein
MIRAGCIRDSIGMIKRGGKRREDIQGLLRYSSITGQQLLQGIVEDHEVITYIHRASHHLLLNPPLLLVCELSYRTAAPFLYVLVFSSHPSSPARLLPP